MKKVCLLFLLSTICFSRISAQLPVSYVTIDDSKLERDITSEVEKSIAGDVKWGLSRLLARCTAQTPEQVTASIRQLTANTRPLSSEETYSRCSEAILLFCRYYDCGNCNKMHAGISGTATVLSPDGICLTNNHVMDNIIRNDKDGLKGDSLYFVATMNGKCYPVTDVLAYSVESDAAIFKIDTQGDELSYIPLGQPALTGSGVRLISHPHGAFYYYSEGIVARNMVHFGQDGKERRRMQISADFAAGSSGGAILDKCGNLIGMVESTNSIYYNPEKKTDLQMVFKNTIPVGDIKSLLGL